MRFRCIRIAALMSTHSIILGTVVRYLITTLHTTHSWYAGLMSQDRRRTRRICYWLRSGFKPRRPTLAPRGAGMGFIKNCLAVAVLPQREEDCRGRRQIDP